MRVARVVFTLAVATLLPTAASAQAKKTVQGSLGMDAAVLGSLAGGSRTDVATFVLVTSRLQLALEDNVTFSVGLGIPLLQLLPIFGGRGAGRGVIPYGLGINVPFEVQIVPAGRTKDGVLFSVGAAPLVATADVCVIGDGCPGSKAFAVVYGVAGMIGGGYQWKGGHFVRAAYSGGPLWAAGHRAGVLAVEGYYHGGSIGFGVGFN